MNEKPCDFFSLKHDRLTETETQALAKVFAQTLTAPLVLAFQGEIGAGKTTFIRAMLRALGITGAIKSPTFSLVESYACETFTVHHFDLYRIHDETELAYMGFRDYFEPHAICCIEWPERAATTLARCDVILKWSVVEDLRSLLICANSSVGEQFLRM